MAPRAVFALVMLLGLTVACGGTGDRATGNEAHDDRAMARLLAEAEDLQRAFGSARTPPIVTAMGGGALILGGAQVEDGDPDDQRIRPVGDAYWVDEEGLVTDLGPLPTSDPLGDVSVTPGDGSAFVAGMTCRTGSMSGDTGEMTCEPGELALLRFRAADLSWERIGTPGGAPKPAPMMGAVTAHGLGERVAYSVLGDRAGTADVWISTDERMWIEIGAPEDSVLCATDGELLAIDDRALAPDDGLEPNTIEPPLTPDTTFSVSVKRFDARQESWQDVEQDEDPQHEVVRGGTIRACTAAAGYVTLDLTGDDTDALVAVRADGRVQVVDDFDGRRVAGITPTSGPRVLVHAEGGLFAVDPATGETRFIELDDRARVVGAVGQEFALLFTDRLELKDL